MQMGENSYNTAIFAMKEKTLHIVIAVLLLFAMPTDSSALFTKIHTPQYYEESAREAFGKQQWEEGKKFLDQGWPEFGSRSTMNELMGRYYFHYKKYDKARFYLVKSLREDQSNSVARELMIAVEEETKNYSSAICYINELLERNPYSRKWWRKKINLYRLQGNNEEAERLLTRLQQIYPNDEVVKKDVAYINEQRLAKMKKNGSAFDQIEAMEKLVQTYPEKKEYYTQLVNTLLQFGRNEDAIEVAGRGVKMTHDMALMKKRADILCELGRYTEAVNYLKDCERLYRGVNLSGAIDATELLAAQNAQRNDPYTSMANVFAKQHNNEALNYLLNTSIARGYYDDALMYVREAKELRGETEDILYKEYIVNRRLGNRSAAYNALVKIYKINPNNYDATEYLCQMKYANSLDNMNYGQYHDAIEDLEFIQENTKELDVKKAAMIRLFSCFYETRRFDQAHDLLTLMRSQFDFEGYVQKRAMVLNAEGRPEAALKRLGRAFEESTDGHEAELLAYQYEEYAIPFIRNMIKRGMIHQADKAAKLALKVCPASNELLHQALTTADILKNYNDYEEMVIAGRARFPEDPFFIVKEASVFSRAGDHAGAIELLQPELENFMGDSLLVATYAVASAKYALQLAKAKDYQGAMAQLDSALVYSTANKELLHTKGLVFEQMHQYDSAYVYQREYKPSLMDYREHSRHLEELRGKNYENYVTLAYVNASLSNGGGSQSDVLATYTRKLKHDELTFNVGYAGRDGIAVPSNSLANPPVASGNIVGGASADASNASADGLSGGTGVKLGADWTHHFTSIPLSVTAGAAWGSKFFSEVTANVAVSYETKNGWTPELHGTYRRIFADKYRNLGQAGLAVSKKVGDFNIRGGVDGFLIMDRYYCNGSLRGMFYPIEDSRTNIFAVAGVGNAPQEELLDNAMPGGFGKLNTYVGAGLFWVFNKHIAASLDATWHTMKNDQTIFTGIWGSSILTRDNGTTDYSNLFNIRAKVHIGF